MRILKLSTASRRTCSANSSAEGFPPVKGKGMTDLPATTYQYDRWSSIVKDRRRWRRPDSGGSRIMAALVPAILDIMQADIGQNPDSELWGKVAYPRINPEPE